MYKRLLTFFAIVMVFTANAFAVGQPNIPADAVAADCTYEVLTTPPDPSYRTVKLQARWTPNKYDVIYKPGAHVVPETDSYTDENGATFDAPYDVLSHDDVDIYPDTGYEFDGWECSGTDKNNNVVDLLIDADNTNNHIDKYNYITDLICTAQWDCAEGYAWNQDNSKCEIETYNIFYKYVDAAGIDRDVEEWEENEDRAHLSVYDITTQNFTVDIPIRAGYIFQGWCLDGERTCDSPKYSVIIKPKNQKHDIVLYAQWIRQGCADGETFVENPLRDLVGENVTAWAVQELNGAENHSGIADTRVRLSDGEWSVSYGDGSFVSGTAECRSTVSTNLTTHSATEETCFCHATGYGNRQERYRYLPMTSSVEVPLGVNNSCRSSCTQRCVMAVQAGKNSAMFAGDDGCYPDAYHVRFDCGEGTPDTGGPADPNYAEAWENHVVPYGGSYEFTNTDKICFCPANTEFKEWSCVDENGNQDSYVENEIINPYLYTSDLMCTAICQGDAYNIQYLGGRVNGITVEDVYMPEQSVRFGETVTLQENTYAVDGYDFNGWSCVGTLNGDTQSSTIDYEDRAVINPYNYVSDLVCTAQWLPAENIIELDKNAPKGGQTSSSPTQLYAQYSIGAYLSAYDRTNGLNAIMNNQTNNYLMTSANNPLTMAPVGRMVNVTFDAANLPAGINLTDIPDWPSNRSERLTFTGFYDSSAADASATRFIDADLHITDAGLQQAASITQTDTWYAGWDCVRVDLHTFDLPGYIFQGWTRDGSTTFETPQRSVYVCDSADFTAHWKPTSSTLVYDCGSVADGVSRLVATGNAPVNQTLTYGEQFVLARTQEECVLNKYSFAGWSCDYDIETGEHTDTVYGLEEDSNIVNKTGIAGVADNNTTVTCRAIWQPRDYNITYYYVYNNETPVPITGLTPTSYVYGVGVPAANMPVKQDVVNALDGTGYTPIANNWGWYASRNNNTGTLSNLTNYVPNYWYGHKALYVKVEKLTCPDGYIADTSDILSTSQCYRLCPQEAGQTLNTNRVYYPETLEDCSYTTNSWNIHYDCGNGVDVEYAAEPVEYGANYVLNDGDSCNKDYYTFYSWSCDNLTDKTGIYLVDEDSYCQAVWNPNPYNVEYYCVFGENRRHNSEFNITQVYDIAGSDENYGCGEFGKTFTGWNCTYTDSNNESHVVQDGDNVVPYTVTCLPRYEAKDYTITYKINGAVVANNLLSPTSYTVVQDIVLPTELPDNLLPEGYVFAQEWHDELDSNHPVVAGWNAGDRQDVQVFYAGLDCDDHYVMNNGICEKERFTVTYQSGEHGTGGTTETVEYDTVYSLLTVDEAGIVPDTWYEYNGWNCETETTHVALAIDNNQITMPAENVICTAKWKVNCPQGYHRQENSSELFNPNERPATHFIGKRLNGELIYNDHAADNFNLGEWGVYFSNGTLRGTSICSSTTGRNSGDVSSTVNETATGRGCWCKPVMYNSAQLTSNDWVFNGNYGSYESCVSECTGYCAILTRDEPEFRLKIFEAINGGAGTDVCVPDEYTITYMDKRTEIDGLMPATYTYGVGATLPVDPEVSHDSYRFVDWCAGYNPETDEYSDCGQTAVSTTDRGHKVFYARWEFVCESGKWWHIDDEKICLYKSKGTNAAVSVDLDAGIHYLLMKEQADLPIHKGSQKKFRIQRGNKVYNAYDKSVITW